MKEINKSPIGSKVHGNERVAVVDPWAEPKRVENITDLLVVEEVRENCGLLEEDKKKRKVVGFLEL